MTNTEGVAYSVEDDGVAPPEAAAEPQPPAQPPAEPPADLEPEGTVEVQGQKHVPLQALQALREELKPLKATAARVQQVEQWYQEHRPYVEFLKAHPDLLTRQTTTQPVQQPEPQTDDAAVQLAQTLDLYTADGKPDVARAVRIRSIMRQEADASADARIKPVRESSIRDRATVAYNRALSLKAPNGMTPQPQYLQAIYQQAEQAGNLEFLSTDQGAAVAAALAVGLQTMTEQPGAPPILAPNSPPVVTEPVGGRLPSRPAISDMEARVANIRGIKQDKWQEYTKQFRPGEPNVLEND